ncbi:MAG: hypothetical protein ACE15F_22845 [bacterium]
MEFLRALKNDTASTLEIYTNFMGIALSPWFSDRRRIADADGVYWDGISILPNFLSFRENLSREP